MKQHPHNSQLTVIVTASVHEVMLALLFTIPATADSCVGLDVCSRPGFVKYLGISWLGLQPNHQASRALLAQRP